MATILDVARAAGVATSTVSHVLNRTRTVSPETTRAVEAAIRAVGYTPNVLARALAQSVTNTIGLAVSASANHYFVDVINAIEAECARLGMMVLLANTRDDPEEELKVVAAFHQRRVDGIVLAPSGGSHLPAIQYLRAHAIPAVMVDRLPADDFDGIGVENHEATIALVTHLVGKGHSRIGYVAGQKGFTTTNERTEGFATGLRRHGLAPERDLMSVGHSSIGSARDAAVTMMDRSQAPTAFIGGNNLTTLGIMNALSDLSLDVPKDIALVGFDDFEWSDYFSPRLTVMAQPCQEIGRLAALRLKFRISNPTAHAEVQRLSPSIRIRESCGLQRE